MFGGGGAVLLDDAKAVEARRAERAVVQPAERSRPTHPTSTLPHLALDVTRDEVALRLDELDDLGPDPELGGDARRGVLGRAVDPEQLGVLAADPQDQLLSVDRILKLRFVIPPPSGSIVARCPGQIRSASCPASTGRS